MRQLLRYWLEPDGWVGLWAGSVAVEGMNCRGRVGGQLIIYTAVIPALEVLLFSKFRK